MTSGVDQLAADFENVQKTLELYPSINVIQVDGDPPENYEIEYLVKGYVQDRDGSIRIGSQHRIHISLPFGYPHFPPTVKPLTPIFHPDIDPDAVRITNYWQENQSLPELILHIGEMICGNSYNLEDPYSQEAADWYAAHLDELPLGDLQVADIAFDENQPDTLADDTLDQLGLVDEEESSEEGLSSDVIPELERIQSLIEQKEMVAADQLLHKISAAASVPDQEEIEHVISAALREGEKLYNQVKTLADKDKINEAMELLEQTAATVSDLPGLENMRLRLQQALAMSESYSDQISEDDTPSPSPEKPPPPPRKLTKPHIDTGNIPFTKIGALILILLIAAAGGLTYFHDNSALQNAENSWQKTEQYVQKQQFQEAEHSAQTARTALDKILLLRSRKAELKKKISTLCESTEFQQGIQGRIQYKNQYLPREVVTQLVELDRRIGDADALIKQGKINKAISSYRTASSFAHKNGLLQQEQLIKQTISNLTFEETLTKARKAEKAREWDDAAAIYKRALELSKTLSDVEGTSAISKKLARAMFHHELDQSRLAFTSAQWQQTIEMLEDAHKLLDKNPETVTDRERWELDQLLAQSRLNQILSLAGKAFKNREWDTAIKEYQRALDLMNKKKSFFAGSYDTAIAEIKKTMLKIKITSEHNAAIQAERQDDLKTALSHYRAIEQLIQKSELSGESSIQAIEKNIHSQILNKTAKLEMDDRIHWLEKNFEKLFKNAYPSSRSSELNHPRVTFIKQEKGKQIFNITCVEHNHGSSFRLELNYQLNSATGKWSRYTGQL